MSFQLFLSENKSSLLFRFLIESPGDLTKDDTAVTFEGHFKYYKRVVLSVYLKYNTCDYNGQTSFYCRVLPKLQLIMLSET